jgi:hypothetical protein
MGFFSWLTMDTDKSICNTYSSRRPFPVDMVDDKGNVYHEEEYEGYGVFGGKDYYELLAEMNGFKSELQGDEYTNAARNWGIHLAYDNVAKDVKHPNLVEMAEGWPYNPIGPESCPAQGYFYDEDD